MVKAFFTNNMKKIINEKRKVLFGNNMNNIKRLVICPINFIFEKFESNNISKGWWKVKYIGNTAIVKSPLASHARDTVAYLPNLEEVIVIGFCGSFTNSMPGEIVTVKKSVFKNSTIKAKPFNEYAKKIFHLTDSFSQQETEDFLLYLKNNAIDCVDMETHHIFDEMKKFQLKNKKCVLR
ncbi:MAG: hypothetical protein KC550_07270, partial [Nanoarchaeota archaeon]|nr:hypothetical protein [Nanoarchaeota archaeon]